MGDSSAGVLIVEYVHLVSRSYSATDMIHKQNEHNLLILCMLVRIEDIITFTPENHTVENIDRY